MGKKATSTGTQIYYCDCPTIQESSDNPHTTSTANLPSTTPRTYLHIGPALSPLYLPSPSLHNARTLPFDSVPKLRHPPAPPHPTKTRQPPLPPRAAIPAKTRPPRAPEPHLLPTPHFPPNCTPNPHTTPSTSPNPHHIPHTPAISHLYHPPQHHIHIPHPANNVDPPPSLPLPKNRAPA